MSGLISIVLWIIIMAAVSGVLKRKSSGGSGEGNPYYNQTPPAPPAYTPPPAPQPRQPGMREIQSVTAPVNTGATNYSAGTVPDKSRHAGTKNTAYSPSQKKGREADMSTTDYLRQKANLDEADHRQEKQQEFRRARWETGGLPAAKRLYEGDSVPQGMRRVACSYCGADNLLPQGSGQKYTCYFCREELE